MRYHITLLSFLLTTLTCAAQQPGINPKNMTDCRTAQLKGNVACVTETSTAIDFSRHTIELGPTIGITKHYYDSVGNISKEERFDGNGLLIQKTIYQYKDGLKHVTTTYDASDVRTMQMLYANTADGFCARIRCTDAIGVTISTSEISIYDNKTKQTEEFQDGEVVDTEWFYNVKGELIKCVSSGQETNSTSTYSINENGFPTKCIVKSNNARIVYEYKYGKISPEGNWLDCMIYKNGVPIEKCERVITLH